MDRELLMQLLEEDNFEDIRSQVTWGVLGRIEKGVTYAPIKELTDLHIHNIINDGYTGIIVQQMKRELEYRVLHDITIEDEYKG